VIIIQNRKAIYRHYYENSGVEFVQRQTNEVVYSLLKAVTLAANFLILVEIS